MIVGHDLSLIKRRKITYCGRGSLLNVSSSVSDSSTLVPPSSCRQPRTWKDGKYKFTSLYKSHSELGKIGRSLALGRKTQSSTLDKKNLDEQVVVTYVHCCVLNETSLGPVKLVEDNVLLLLEHAILSKVKYGQCTKDEPDHKSTKHNWTKRGSLIKTWYIFESIRVIT